MPYKDPQVHRDYMKRRYHAKMKLGKKILGGKCKRCGSRSRLEFDHKNPANKTTTIAKMWNYSIERFNAELRKCQLLCHDCHLAKTHVERLGPLTQR